MLCVSSYMNHYYSGPMADNFVDAYFARSEEAGGAGKWGKQFRG